MSTAPYRLVPNGAGPSAAGRRTFGRLMRSDELLIAGVLGLAVFGWFVAVWFALRRAARRVGPRGRSWALRLLGFAVCAAVAVGAWGLGFGWRMLLFGLALGSALAATGTLLFVFVRGPVVRPPRKAFHMTAVVVVLTLLFTFVCVPLTLAGFLMRQVGTRGDERGYQGPVFSASGEWMFQRRGELASADGENAWAVAIESADGVRLRGFWLPQERDARFAAVCVHGLFRGGLELEPVGSLFREFGGDLLMLELRNHGGSDRSAIGFGVHEKSDVVGAVDWVLQQIPGDRPLVLFGVSLGSCAVALAVPELASDVHHRLAAVVLDSPMASMGDAARRRIGEAFPWPTDRVLLGALGFWTGVPLDQVRPVDAVQRFPDRVEVLVVAGEEDAWMPPEQVRRVFEALPSRAKSALWMVPRVGHGRAFVEHIEGYRGQLRALLDRALRRGH